MREDVGWSARIERPWGAAVASSAVRMLPLAAGIVATALVTVLAFAFPAGAQRSTPTPIYEDTHYTFAERAADLVARLTAT
jgi:hypothetical protein